MIRISMDELGSRQSEGYISNYARCDEDPFKLIDTTYRPDKTARDIADGIKKVADELRNVAHLIHESGDEVVIDIESMSNIRHDETRLENIVAMMASYITDSKDDSSYRKKDPQGWLTLSFRTEYSFLDILLGIVWYMMEHADATPDWWDAIKDGSIRMYTRENTVKFRVAALALNLIGALNWQERRDKKDEEASERLDKYGIVGIEPTSDIGKKVLRLCKCCYRPIGKERAGVQFGETYLCNDCIEKIYDFSKKS